MAERICNVSQMDSVAMILSHSVSSRVVPVTLLLALMVFTGRSQNITVTVKVVAPEETPDSAMIFIAGNKPVLGDWNPGRVGMTKGPSTWDFQFEASKGEVIEFKITRGSWSNQAVYRKDQIPDNIRFTAAKDTLITITPFSWQDLRHGASGGITGAVRYHRGLKGAGLNYTRDVVVWLPPSYEKENSTRYPVLYMHDGQNILDPSTSFIGYDWRIDEMTDSLIRSGAIQEIIIVGISNSPDRSPEYSDTRLGRSYASFVVHTLKPMIDSLYRTKPEAAHTSVMGSSMGGLISFLFAWWYPDVFSQAGCLSSAFLFDDNKILKEVRDYSGPRKNLRFYLDCGTVDLEARLRPGSEEMAKILEEKGYNKGIAFEYYLDDGAVHNERAWAERVWRPLTFFFRKK